jgi:sterol desaturase/sphingolipid hydroxylase (fatty acid hydroxylase superfamily)
MRNRRSLRAPSGIGARDRFGDFLLHQRKYSVTGMNAGFIAWLGAGAENIGFTLYCLSLALFAAVEAWHPAFAEPRRRHERWPVNAAIGLANIGLSIVTPITGVVVARWAEGHGVGLLNYLQSPLWLALIVTVLVRSLQSYAIHVLMHKVPLLWRIHRVHHSDTHLDASTSLRNHPFEFAVVLTSNLAVTLALGLNPWALIIFEVVESVASTAAHANLRLPERFDRALRVLFVTPNMHSLHHSAWQPETDSNYGQVFSFWDRLFGTYSAAPRNGYDALKIGLKEIDFEHATDVVWQMKSPVLTIGSTGAVMKKTESAEGR